ncbi:MAG TPA: hypothetical protein VNM35_08055 [Chitinophagaceae bacterium]|nr:hypothetical protein [Chitinophagaceae bacterium]
MNTQNFRMVKDDNRDIFCQEVYKTKRSNFLLILPMLLLFSCSKNIAELPDQANVEESISNQSSQTQVSNSVESVPFERTLFVPCGNGGEGEEVALNGSIKLVEQIIFNDHGFTFTYHAVLQGISGLGLSTGENFVVSGGDKGTITGEFGEEGQYTRVFMGQLRIIGQSSAFTVRYKFKVTITPNGNITTRIEQEEIDCRM